MKDAQGSAVDPIYLKVQIEGHLKLLQLQEEILQQGLSDSSDVVHVALIARAFIRNHLIALKLLSGGG